MDSKRTTHRSSHSLSLRLLAGLYAICRTSGGNGLEWVDGEFTMVARSRHEVMETTVICPESAVPADVERDGGWHVIRVEGVFAFGEVGVLASLIEPLRDGGVAVLTVGTFETDYLLIKSERLDRVREVLEAAGHRFIEVPT